MLIKLKSKFAAYFFIALAGVFLVIFLNYIGLMSGVKNITYKVFSPPMIVFQRVGAAASNALGFIAAIKDLSKDNTRLTQENNSLLSQVAALKESERENSLLRRQLNLNAPEKRNLIFAQIIAYGAEAGQYLIINKGSADGVVLGLAAVDADNFFVGKIFATGKNFSKIILLADPDARVNAITQETRISGIIKGENGLAVIMDMIPLDKPVRKDEPVITSGLDSLIPKGIIIGWIADVVSKGNEVFQKVTLRPAANPQSLENVFIIK